MPRPPHVPFPVGGEGSRHDDPRPLGFESGEELTEVAPQGLGHVNIVCPNVEHQGQQVGMFDQDGGQHPGQVHHLGTAETECFGFLAG